MTNALRALLSGIIDYAGLFPPASLPMEPAIRNYARYRTEPEAWMLGRFVCPAERLKELSPLVDELFTTGEPLRLSALGRTGKTTDEWNTAQFQTNNEDMASFLGLHEERVSIEVLETPKPPKPQPGERQGWTRKGERKWLVFKHPSANFRELELTTNWRTEITEWIRGMTEAKQLGREAIAQMLVEQGKPLGKLLDPNSLQLGFKLRCGGATAAAFPPPEEIAFALVACRDAGIPFKATAGLHHPIRQYRDEVKTKMHGFLNVFGAGALAHACKLTEEQVLDIIVDEDPKNFVFDDNSFRWKEHRATIDQVTAARQLVTSFGSCSFDEPREDLRALGLL